MHRKLPPLPAIRAFEASARLLSFRKAAEELFLTQSAISHQIKALEVFLGAKLFLRSPRGILLTDEGAGYFAGITSILDRLDEETARVSTKTCSGRLSVRAAPGMARWLAPRLGAFYEAYPDIDLLLTSSLVAADFASDDVDINIRWGFSPARGLLVAPLMQSTRYPVISPELLRTGPEIRAAGDLCHHTLLHEAGCPDLGKWFTLTGVSVENPHKGLRFSQYDQLLHAVIEGQGVGLGVAAIVAHDISANRLVRLFDTEFPASILYSIVTPESWARRPQVAAFRTWVMKEASLAWPAGDLSGSARERAADRSSAN